MLASVTSFFQNNIDPFLENNDDLIIYGLTWGTFIGLLVLGTIFILYYRSKWRKYPEETGTYMGKMLYRIIPIIFFTIYFFCAVFPQVYPSTLPIVGVIYIILVTLYVFGEYLLLTKR